MAGVYVQTVTQEDTAVVLIPGLKNLYLRVFPIAGNTDSVLVGDANVKYSTGYGIPIGVNAIYTKKIFVEDSNRIYYSGLAGDKLGVVIEQSPIIDDVLPALDVLKGLIRSSPDGSNLSQSADIARLQQQVAALIDIISHSSPGIISMIEKKIGLVR